jgi:hypothetical protein
MITGVGRLLGDREGLLEGMREGACNVHKRSRGHVSPLDNHMFPLPITHSGGGPCGSPGRRCGGLDRGSLRAHKCVIFLAPLMYTT